MRESRLVMLGVRPVRLLQFAEPRRVAHRLLETQLVQAKLGFEEVLGFGISCTRSEQQILFARCIWSAIVFLSLFQMGQIQDEVSISAKLMPPERLPEFPYAEEFGPIST